MLEPTLTLYVVGLVYVTPYSEYCDVFALPLLLPWKTMAMPE